MKVALMVTRKDIWSKEWLSLNEKHREIISDVQEVIPVAVGVIANNLGLQVKVATLELGVSGEIAPAGNTFKIRINKHEVKNRQRFTLAHEISHFLLHRDLIIDGIYDSVLYRSRLSNEIEVEANRLAADILMPNKQVMKSLDDMRIDGRSKRDCVVMLANDFQVSEDAMAIRLGVK